MIVLCMQMYFETWNYICFWGVGSLRSLAHISYMYMIFFFGTFGGPAPPPPYQKAGYATVPVYKKSDNRSIENYTDPLPNWCPCIFSNLCWKRMYAQDCIVTYRWKAFWFPSNLAFVKTLLLVSVAAISCSEWGGGGGDGIGHLHLATLLVSESWQQ